jgi:hypothetical protein
MRLLDRLKLEFDRAIRKRITLTIQHLVGRDM